MQRTARPTFLGVHSVGRARYSRALPAEPEPSEGWSSVQGGGRVREVTAACGGLPALPFAFAFVGRARHSCARRLNFAKASITLLGLLQKWICQSFPADDCRRPVAGEHGHIVAQREQLFPDPGD